MKSRNLKAKIYFNGSTALPAEFGGIRSARVSCKCWVVPAEVQMPPPIQGMITFMVDGKTYSTLVEAVDLIEWLDYA